MTDTNFEIKIPTDNDGYILFKCPKCTNYFKVKPSDVEDDGILQIFCPACGLSSENYLTDDIIELALSKVGNYANNLIFQEMKKWEQEFSGSGLSFKAGKKPTEEYEVPIRSTIEAMNVRLYQCCARTAKIKPLLEMTSSYCPFCGVKDFGTE
ncbi:TFIIB-type zinc ribbon-containing protein [Lactococcus hircilactis]|uniref:TFIIB-type zinc ribbon-containing protein n=1 Tax=Lactococcus hircilactis TaxID=1494462 RepID=A0A7X2D1P1_9LACT|nr:TFIIB-type zinc ribbon-containing protein [Lactococcus hircilactis]MQW39265.1 TFIIB-type zinc ribbon-containing protein [Lactococcus hircilactis]